MTKAIGDHYELAQQLVRDGKWKIDTDSGLIYGMRGKPRLEAERCHGRTRGRKLRRLLGVTEVFTKKLESQRRYGTAQRTPVLAVGIRSVRWGPGSISTILTPGTAI